MVWVVPEVKVTVLGAPMVKLLNVLEPDTITAPVPAPVMERFPKVTPPLVTVLDEADVSVMAIVEPVAVNVKFPMVPKFMIVAVVGRVTVELDIFIALNVEPEELSTCEIFIPKPFDKYVPLFRIKFPAEPVVDKASC
jgi:hypothetical protein